VVPYKQVQEPPVSGAGQLEALVDEDQIRLLYGKGVLYYFTSPINASLFAIVIWNRVSHGILIGWIAAFTVLALGRTVLRKLFLARARPPAEAERWARAFAMTSAINGIIWGLGSLVVFVPGALSAQMLLLLIICGMSAGATALDSTYLPAFFAFLVPELFPFAVLLIAQRDLLHDSLAGLVVMFGIAMSLLARHSGHTTRDAARLRFRNALLVEDLTLATQRLAALNENLELRVDERTRQLQEALSVRDDFLSIASHELKTPLTSLNLQLQLLEKNLRRGRDTTPAELEDRFGILRRQTGRLSSLVDTLLDVSRLDSDRVVVEVRPLDLAVLVRRIVDEMREEVRLSGSTVTLETPESLPARGDPVRLAQVVTNLLANAIKYGEGKPISIALDGAGGEAHLRVRDEGIGIAPEDLGRIFGKFQRGVPAKGYSGFGLGLFVVERLVSGMGGRVEVQSTVGRGAEFTVRLPLHLP
jgi:signal transduction histidine kinase